MYYPVLAKILVIYSFRVHTLSRKQTVTLRLKHPKTNGTVRERSTISLGARVYSSRNFKK